MTNNESYFINDFDRRFGTYDVRDENFHSEYRNAQTHYALTETQFFGFSIPEENIHAFLYLWSHPNLNVVSAGPMIFRGKKAISLASELFDYRNYMPDSQIAGDLTSFRLDNSYEVRMLEPGRRFRVSYADPDRHNAFEVEYDAVSEPMVWASSRHFEQVMRVEGELTLRGKRFDVGGFNIRDRSWGEARLESPVPGPPATWMTGTFDEGFAFNVTALDHPETNPIWKGQFDVDAAKVTKFGWMIVDGEPVVIESARKSTIYDRVNLLPSVIEMDILDVRGRRFLIKGVVTAAVPFSTWLNVRVPVCLARWECNGKIGYGDVQEAQWTDFLRDCYQGNTPA